MARRRRKKSSGWKNAILASVVGMGLAAGGIAALWRFSRPEPRWVPHYGGPAATLPRAASVGPPESAPFAATPTPTPTPVVEIAEQDREQLENVLRGVQGERSKTSPGARRSATPR